MKKPSGFSTAQWIILGGVLVLVVVVLVIAGQLALAVAQPLPTLEAPAAPPTVPASTLPPATATAPVQAQTTPTDGALTLVPSAQAADPMQFLPPGAARVEAQVNQVVDGVTLEVLLNGQKQTVRYLGAETLGSGEAALAYNRGLLEGKTVTLIKDAFETDVQGALLRYVLVGDEFVNYTLIRSGLANVALYPPGAACADTFVQAQRQASAEHAGFWAASAQSAPTLAAVHTAVVTITPPCDCNHAYQCSEFRSHASAQACYDACGDYRNVSLDPDHNGLACEELP